MRNHDPINEIDEFHILMEYLGGGDMSQYIKEQGRAFTIERVKEI